jgi:hypothetical protein
MALVTPFRSAIWTAFCDAFVCTDVTTYITYRTANG